MLQALSRNDHVLVLIVSRFTLLKEIKMLRASLETERNANEELREQLVSYDSYFFNCTSKVLGRKMFT